MKEVSIRHVKIGQQLADQVKTSLGGTLFQKGHEIIDKDIATLRAFMIDKIIIESETVSLQTEVAKDQHMESMIVESSSGEYETSKQILLEKEYFKLVKQTEKLFVNLQGWMNPPIIEIREYLIPFVKKAIEQPSFVLHILKLSTIDSYQAHHAVAVSVITSFLALKSGIEAKEIPQVCLAGYLHNIGQLKLDPEILNKTVALTQQEFKEVQKHPTYGFAILNKTSGLSEGVIKAALQHHEREDGSGYPMGTKSEHIHPYAKMIAITDVFYAMCSERTYKIALSPFLVLDQLKNDSYGKLDPKYVYLFVELITSFLSVGTKVMLNNGYVGEVVYIDKNSPTRPLINCDGEIINLQQVKELYIDHLDL